MSTAKPRIRVLASDWGHVQVEFDNRLTASSLLPFCTGRSVEEIHDLMFVSTRDLFDGFMRGAFSASQFRQAWRVLLPLDGCDDAAFDRAMGDAFFSMNVEVLGRWQALKTLGVRVVSASNMDPIRHAHLQTLRICGPYHAHCLSYQVGAVKPEQAFFARLLAIAGCPADEIVFVDDHPEFGAVAQGFGMRFVHFHGGKHDIGHLDAQLARYDFVPFLTGAAPLAPA